MLIQQQESDLKDELHLESDNEEHVEGTHRTLLSAVSQLYNKQRVTRPQRGEPAAEVSEFHLSSSNAAAVEKGGRKSNNKVAIVDLAKVLNKKGSHVGIADKLKQLKGKAKTLPKPVEKIHADKIVRIVGYRNLKNHLGRWDALVQRNRAADQIVYPLHKIDEVKIDKSEGFLSTFKTPTELELQVAAILKTSNTHQEEKKCEEELYPLSIYEMVERRKMLARVRAQESYKMAKAARQNRIKSKKYHRILRQERIKEELKEFEALKEKDPEAALEKLQQLEKARAEERASLRHRNTGHWAKSRAIRAKYNKEARAELAEQLAKSRELTQKLKANEDSSSDGEEEDTTLGVPENNPPSANNPWIAANGTADETTEVQDFISGYKKFWKRQKKADEPLGNTRTIGNAPKVNRLKTIDPECVQIIEESICNKEAKINSDEIHEDSYESDHFEIVNDEQEPPRKEDGDSISEEYLLETSKYQIREMCEAPIEIPNCAVVQKESSQKIINICDNGNYDLKLAEDSDDFGSQDSFKLMLPSLVNSENENENYSGDIQRSADVPKNKESVSPNRESVPPDVIRTQPPDYEVVSSKVTPGGHLTLSLEELTDEVIPESLHTSDPSLRDSEMSVIVSNGNKFFVSTERMSQKRQVSDRRNTAKSRVKRRRYSVVFKESVLNLSGSWSVTPSKDNLCIPPESHKSSDINTRNEECSPKNVSKSGKQRGNNLDSNINFTRPNDHSNLNEALIKINSDSQIIKEANESPDLDSKLTIDDIFSRVECSLKKTANLKYKLLKDDMAAQKKESDENTREEKVEDYVPDLSMKKSRIRSDLDEAMIELAQEGISNGPNVDFKKLLSISNSLDVEESKDKPNINEQQKDDINPNKFLNIKPKYLPTQVPNLITGAGEDAIEDEDEDDAENEKQMNLAEAFADDDVIEEFKQAKEDDIKDTQPKDLDLTLPGWGSWGGCNIVKVPKRKGRRFIIKFPKINRKDKDKPNIIITERGNQKIRQHMVSELPHPFTSVKDFEASVRAPLGSTWVSQLAQKKLTICPVITKKGTIIEPIDDSQLINEDNKR